MLKICYGCGRIKMGTIWVSGERIDKGIVTDTQVVDGHPKSRVKIIHIVLGTDYEIKCPSCEE